MIHQTLSREKNGLHYKELYELIRKKDINIPGEIPVKILLIIFIEMKILQLYPEVFGN
jgi:hypothetical protein